MSSFRLENEKYPLILVLQSRTWNAKVEAENIVKKDLVFYWYSTYLKITSFNLLKTAPRCIINNVIETRLVLYAPFYVKKPPKVLVESGWMLSKASCMAVCVLHFFLLV